MRRWCRLNGRLERTEGSISWQKLRNHEALSTSNWSVDRNLLPAKCEIPYIKPKLGSSSPSLRMYQSRSSGGAGVELLENKRLAVVKLVSRGVPTWCPGISSRLANIYVNWSLLSLLVCWCLHGSVVIQTLFPAFPLDTLNASPTMHHQQRAIDQTKVNRSNELCICVYFTLNKTPVAIRQQRPWSPSAGTGLDTKNPPALSWNSLGDL